MFPSLLAPLFALQLAATGMRGRLCTRARVSCVVAAASVLVPWVYQKHYERARGLLKTDDSGGVGSAVEGPVDAFDSPAPASSRREETFYRYYRVFSREDLLKLCEKEKRVKVIDCYNDTNNWAVLLEKCNG